MDTDKTLWKTIYKNNKKKEQQKIKIYNTILSKCENTLPINFGDFGSSSLRSYLC